MPQIYGLDKLEKATHYKVHNFASLILMNKGNGKFETQELPIEAQFSPTLSIAVADINNDGFLDIYGVGNIYDAEVETIRYDASKGYILLGNKEGKFNFLNDNSYFNDNENKAIKQIIINEILHFITLNKNNFLSILKVK